MGILSPLLSYLCQVIYWACMRYQPILLSPLMQDMPSALRKTLLPYIVVLLGMPTWPSRADG